MITSVDRSELVLLVENFMFSTRGKSQGEILAMIPGLSESSLRWLLRAIETGSYRLSGPNGYNPQDQTINALRALNERTGANEVSTGAAEPQLADGVIAPECDAAKLLGIIRVHGFAAVRDVAQLVEIVEGGCHIDEIPLDMVVAVLTKRR